MGAGMGAGLGAGVGLQHHGASEAEALPPSVGLPRETDP
jgi:hypothetical protein